MMLPKKVLLRECLSQHASRVPVCFLLIFRAFVDSFDSVTSCDDSSCGLYCRAVPVLVAKIKGGEGDFLNRTLRAMGRFMCIENAVLDPSHRSTTLRPLPPPVPKPLMILM